MNANLIQLLLKANESKSTMDIELVSGETVTGVISFSKKQIDVNGILYNIADILDVKEHVENPVVQKLEELLSECVFIRLSDNSMITGFLMSADEDEVMLVTTEDQLTIKIADILDISDDPSKIATDDADNNDNTEPAMELANGIDDGIDVPESAAPEYVAIQPESISAVEDSTGDTNNQNVLDFNETAVAGESTDIAMEPVEPEESAEPEIFAELTETKDDTETKDNAETQKYPFSGFEAKVYSLQFIPEDIKSSCLAKFESHDYQGALEALMECPYDEDNSVVLDELQDYLRGVIDRFEDKGNSYKEDYGYCYHGGLAGVIEQNAEKAAYYYKKEIEPWGDFGGLAICCSLSTVVRIGSKELMYKTALDLEKYVGKIETVNGSYSQAQAYKNILVILSRVEDWDHFNVCLNKLINALNDDGRVVAANNSAYKYGRLLMENEKYDYAEEHLGNQLKRGGDEKVFLLLMHCLYLSYGEESYKEKLREYITGSPLESMLESGEVKYLDGYENADDKLEYIDSIIMQIPDDKGQNAPEKKSIISGEADGVDSTGEDMEDAWEDVFANYRKNGQIPAARKFFKKKSAQFPNNECLKLINRRIELWQAQYGSYKSIGSPSTDYERGMFKWFSERSNNEASSLFMTSVNSSDTDKTTALLAFLDFSAVEYGFDQALGNLPILRPLVRELDKRMKITFYEKVYSFAFIINDNGEALSALNSLMNLYYSRSQLGKTEYRIAGIYYLQGKWARAKDHLVKTLKYSYNVDITSRMIEYCDNCISGGKTSDFIFEGATLQVDVARIKSDLQNYYNNIQYEESKSYIKTIYEANSDNEEIIAIKESVEKIVENFHYYAVSMPKKKDDASIAWRAWHIEGDYDKAEKYYRKEISTKSPKTLACILNLAEMSMHVRGNDAGIKVLKDNELYVFTLEISKQAGYFEKLNVMLQKTDDYEEKKKCLEALIRVYNHLNSREKAAFYYYRLGVVAFTSKDYETSIASMEKAVENRYHTISLCYQYIITSYIKSGNEEEAIRRAQALLEKEEINQDNDLTAFLQQTIEKLSSGEDNSDADNLPHEDGEEDDYVEPLAQNDDDKLVTYLLNNQLVWQQIAGENGEDHWKLMTYRKRINELKGSLLANNYHKLAIMENTINGKTGNFYRYLEWCVRLYASDTYRRRDYDTSALWNIYMLSNSKNNASNVQRIKEFTQAILKCALKDTYTESKNEEETADLLERILNSDNKYTEYAFKLLVIAISKSSYLNDSHNGELKRFIENPGYEMFGEQIARFVNMKNIGQLDYDTLLAGIRNRVSADTNFIQTLINKFQSSKSLNEEYVGELRKLRDTIFVLEEDIGIINDLIDVYEKALEIYEYPDYDNRMATIKTVQGSLFEINKKIDDKPTFFGIYYLGDILKGILDVLSIISDATMQDLAPELYITVPITEVETVDNKNMISITVSNKENSAMATSLFVYLYDSEGEQLLENGGIELAQALKGGASKSIELDIPTQISDTFSIRIKVSYKNHMDEMCSCEQDESISTVSTAYEEIVGNPYVDGRALDPEENRNVFMGRDVLLKELESSLVDGSGQCVIIYGQKRCGKTSISNFLMERIRDKFVIISFSAGAVESASQLYNNVRTEFKLQLDIDIYSKKSNVPEEEKPLLMELRREISDMDLSNGEAFIDMVRVIYGRYCMMRDKELLIVIDEFTHLYRLYQSGEQKRSEVTAFMDTWKKGSEKKLFKSLLIGQDTMPYIMAAYPNQLAITAPKRVDRLDDDSVRQLIEQPILLSDGSSRYMEKSVDLIANWFYGQPYYISVYCKSLVEHMKASHKNYVTNAMAEKVKNKMLESSTISLFDNLINAGDIETKSESALWDQPGYKLLCSIAHLTKNSEWANIDDIDIPESEDKDKIIEDLINRSVIEKKMDKCRIYINFFKEWLNVYGR